MFGFRARHGRGTTTPAVTSGTGAITTASASLAYTVQGSRLLFNCTIVITTNGTGATDVEFPLPVTPSAITALSGTDFTAGIALTATANTDGKVYITKYDGTYPGANGKTLYVAGVVRVS